MILALPYGYLRFSLLTLSLLIVHIQPVVYVLSIPIYSFSLVISAFFLAFFSHSFRAYTLKWLIYCLGFILLFALLFVFSLGFPLQYFGLIESSAQLIIGVWVASFISYLIFFRVQLDRIYLYSRFFALFLIFLILLERFLPPFKSLLLFIQQFISYGSYTLYSDSSLNHLRDIGFVGFVRPSLLASEPSLLGILVYVVLVVQIFLAPRANTLRASLLFCIQVIIFFSLVGSPLILLSLLVFYVNFYFSSFKLFVRSLLRFNPNLFIVFLISCIIIPLVLRSTALSRLTNLSYLSFRVDAIDEYLLFHSSYYVRYVAPIITLRETLSINPFFGFGIGGEGSLGFILNLPYPPAILINNNFFYFIAALGVVGLLVVFIALFKYLKIHLVVSFSGFLSLLLLSTTMGAPLSPRFIVYLVIIYSAISKRKYLV